MTQINRKVTSIFKPVITVLALLMIAVAFNPAMALSLQEAKSQGLVGEQSNGYLGAVKPSGAVNALVQQTNDQRKKYYQDIAARNKTQLSAVEKLAGKKAIEKTAKGDYINVGSGWQRK